MFVGFWLNSPINGSFPLYLGLKNHLSQKCYKNGLELKKKQLFKITHFSLFLILWLISPIFWLIPSTFGVISRENIIFLKSALEK